MPDITYRIVKNYGILSEGKGGWKKEINLVSWNNRAPKFDVREWDPGHEKMGKGITLTREEAVKLRDYLSAAIEDGEVSDALPS
ncbi:MAG: hypothetical protein LBT14_03235 [Treponema sp.]|jgi:hypothetical protein|nr:hypothetical protein [Treponema sp.]